MVKYSIDCQSHVSVPQLLDVQGIFFYPLHLNLCVYALKLKPSYRPLSECSQRVFSYC